MKKIKKPISIVLALMMVVSLFAIVPITASAAKITSTVDISELQPGDVVDSYTSISNNNGYTVKIPSGQARQWGNASGVLIDHDVELTNYSFRGSSITNRSGDYSYFVPVDGDGQGPYFAIESVDHDAKVVTVYSPVVYTIQWLNYDNRVLASKKYLAGEMPTYTGSPPSKPANAQYAYTFTGWSEEITAATCNKNYIAQFSASPLPEDYPAPYMGSIYVGNSRATALGEISGTGATSGTVTLSQEGDYNVLTFNNFVYEGRGNTYTISGGSFYSAPISYYGTSPMIIRLIGENRITHTDSTDGNENCCGFYFSSAKETIIEGEGSLSVFSGNSKRGSMGMCLDYSNLIVSKCTLNVRAGTSSNTYIYTTGLSIGAGDCRIEDGASLTVSSGESDNGYGINVSSYGNVVVKSGSFSATGTKSALFYYGDANHTNIVTDSGSTFKVTKAGDTAADAVDVEPGEFINKKYVYAEAGIFHTVTWKNGDTVLKTDTVEEGTAPAYSGDVPEKAEDADYTYTFSGWTDDTDTYGATDTLPEVTGDITYKATFTETAKPKDLFPQHSVSLGGDIGVNFYIDPAAAGADGTAEVSVSFSWNGQTKTVDAVYDGDKGLFKATCDVVAAEVACDITAVATINNVEQAQTDTYSVQTYAEEVYNNPAAYDSEKPEQLKALAKALLNYGAMAQTVFVEYMEQPVEDPADIVSTVGKTDFNAVSADDIAGEAPDLEAVATQLGCKYYTSSVIYLQNNTLRLYFTPNTYPGEMPHADDFDGQKFNYYYYVDKENIAAAELDNQQTFTVGDTTFTFSALDYAKAVVNSGMGDDQKNLAKALYLYNKAANDYFDEPAPAQNIVDLSTVTEDTVVENGYTITGTLKGDYKISIADGATVTLRNVDITCLTNDNNVPFAGITPLGDATIMLEGANTVKGGYENYPGVFVPVGKTLTIDGTGSLTASSNGYGCGIGGGYQIASGNIEIKGGNITATGGQNAAGIGSGGNASCGDITINGGTVTANGGVHGAGIGGGGWSASCGTITITGGTVEATGGALGAGIGNGRFSRCGDITIAATVTSVTATKGSNAPNSIGAGLYGTCGTITIAPGANVIQN